MPFRILLPRTILERMIVHAQQDQPNECCGLLAGNDGKVAQGLPLVNELASPTEYSAEPKSLLQAAKAARLAGQDVLGFYHSHPTSAPVPSKTDLARNAWGSDVVFFIISLAKEEPEVRAWWLDPAAYREAEWEVIDGA